MRNRREQGMALITALLVLLLISSMIVGMSWLVLTDKKLGGNNADRQRAFYGAEAGMEALTTQLQAAFANNYALSAGDITTITNTTYSSTTNVPEISYLTPAGANGFVINFTPDTTPGNLGNPLAQQHTILSGTYAGLVGLLTPYTMQVTARTAMGSETRLQRTVQTVAIPVFQFGLFSDTDLDFFAGPDFNFGGRLHTNGNLWLAENGGTLTLAGKTTAVGQVIRTNLENGFPTTSSYNTTVNITTNPGSSSYANLTTAQGSTTGTSYFGNVSASLNEPTFKNLTISPSNGNLGNGYTGVKPLNLTIATPAIGGTPIDMIRMPLPGELVANPGKLDERYYTKASLRILLSDYGADGTCASSDILGLPYASAGTPVDLADLAWDTSSPNTGAGIVGKAPGPSAGALAGIGTTVFPMPVSAASGGTKYAGTANTNDGYWVKQWFPIETGCIKIDYQTKAGLAWVDVTKEILKLGWTGRNINPNTAPAAPQRPSLPGAQQKASGPTINGAATTVGCNDPSPNAVIRLSRVRDNPSTGACANLPGSAGVQHGTDIWPNVLFDPREGLLRDQALAGNAVTLAGAMHYVELDVTNLDKWFTGTLGASGTLANNTTGYTVYFSDRRGDRKDPAPPPSEGASPAKTGAFGFDDFVNSADVNGCPNNVLEGAEDFESDFTMGTDLNPPATPRTYGEFFPSDASTLASNPNLWKVAAGTQAMWLTGVFDATAPAALANNPTCAGPGKDWPFAVATNAQDLRENPSVYFRRALKLVNGSTISLGTCDTVSCGLTVVAENPIYVQGDYNAGINGNFATPFVADAVIGDAVTLLSDWWNDVNSFAFPYAPGSRTGQTTTYRMAVAGGKTIPFKQPTVNCGTTACSADFGTDGGAHNFLRYIETWSGTLWYKGSLVSLYYSHQGVGTFKCCTTVYNPPTRGYSFQTEFLTPTLLPPKTPMFQAINTIGFTQVVLPTP